jgi:hypothetical protein
MHQVGGRRVRLAVLEYYWFQDVCRAPEWCQVDMVLHHGAEGSPPQRRTVEGFCDSQKCMICTDGRIMHLPSQPDDVAT